jgi:peptidoglycan/LPS O-acetylase OafA/YrhL
MEFLRFLLAACVVISHLWVGGGLGAFSVFGFYIMSGYLMTLVMQEKYGYTWSGRGAFAVNRALHLLPVYWCACGLSIVLILAPFAPAMLEYNRRIYLPTDFLGWLRNVLIFFPSPAVFPEGEQSMPRLSPATWALTVEILCYAMIALGVSATRRRTWVWFGISLTYFLTSYLWLPGEYRYYAVYAASLPFATGAMIYHHRERLARIPWPHPLILLSMVFLNIFGFRRQVDQQWMRDISQLLNIVLFAILISAVAHRPAGSAWPGIGARLERWLGGLSYPIYVVHWQMGFLTFFALAQFQAAPAGRSGPEVALPALILCILFGAAAVRWVDSRTNRLKAPPVIPGSMP